MVIKLFEEYIIESLLDDILKEAVDYEWDLNNNVEIDYKTGKIENTWKDKLKNYINNINSQNQATIFYKNFLQKIKNLPHRIKFNILKYATITIITIISATSAINIAKSYGMQNDVENIIADSTQNNKLNLNDELSFKSPVRMFISENGIEHIKETEALKLDAYKLGDGKISIGYGHAEPIKREKGVEKMMFMNLKVGDKITKEEANKIFKKDIEKFENGVKRIFKNWEKEGINIKLTQNQFDVLVSLAYNMGLGGLRNTEFIQLIKKNKLKEAGEKLKTTAINKKFSGLKIRREKESKLFLSKN